MVAPKEQVSTKEASRLQRLEYRREFKRPKDAKRARAASCNTAGKMKSEDCQASIMDRYFASAARSYKHPGYVTWSATHRAAR